MEESKDLITGYKIFRSLVYISLILEFFLYVVDPGLLGFWGGILADIHGRMRRWFIYAEGNLIWSKVATLLLICITSIGTRNKKQLEFDARKMVLYPLVGGLFIVVLSVWHQHDLKGSFDDIMKQTYNHYRQHPCDESDNEIPMNFKINLSKLN